MYGDQFGEFVSGQWGLEVKESRLLLGGVHLGRAPSKTWCVSKVINVYMWLDAIVYINSLRTRCAFVGFQ